MRYVNYTPANQRIWQSSLIDCYKAVFAAPPWNEEWWTDELVQAVLDQYAGKQARIILAVAGDAVVGFAWGAVSTPTRLNQELELALPATNRTKLGYVKDIGVIEPCRQQGIAQALLRELLTTLRQSCTADDWLYARTLARPNPSVVYHWFPTLGFRCVAEYQAASDRSGQVILGCPFGAVTF